MSAAQNAAARRRRQANAIKASGAIVTVDPAVFLEIIASETAPLIVCAEGGFWSVSYQYLTSYRGLIFLTKSPEVLKLPDDAEIVQAERIWTPE